MGIWRDRAERSSQSIPLPPNSSAPVLPEGHRRLDSPMPWPSYRRDRLLRVRFLRPNPTPAIRPRGPLLVLDKNGNLVESITTGTNGPWGLAVNDLGDSAQLFVSNVFDGTVTRLNVSFHKGSVRVVGSPTTIGSGYAFGLDTAALVVDLQASPTTANTIVFTSPQRTTTKSL